MNQGALPFDICAGRHGGNRESVAANPAPSHKRQSHETILGLLGERAMTGKEIAARRRQPLHTLSGRFTELIAMGLIERTGERRDGCAVLRLKQ